MMSIENLVIKRMLYSSVFRLLSIINQRIRKDKKIILFYCNSTGGFRDNLKAVYDYLLENDLQHHYRIIVSAQNIHEIETVDKVEVIKNWHAVFLFLKAKYVFYGYGKLPIKPSPEQNVVSMFHGTPLKKIGGYLEDFAIKDFFFTYALASSELFRPVFAKAFYCPLDKVVICGHPRNDVLFKSNNCIDKNNRKMIIWLPTYRDNDADHFPLFKIDELKKLDQALGEMEIILFIKLHEGYNKGKIKFEKMSNIIGYRHDEFMKSGYDLYKVIACADAMITDYSSVYFDYLLLNRPIGFTVEDIGIYQRARGFIFENPFEYMPGQKINSREDFVNFCLNVAQKKDDYILERKKVNDLVNYYQDGENTKRLLSLCGIIEAEQ